MTKIPPRPKPRPDAVEIKEMGAGCGEEVLMLFVFGVGFLVGLLVGVTL